MKTFKFKFTRLITTFIYVGIALAVIAFGVNLYFLITDGIKEAANIVYPIIQYTLMFFISVLLLVILVSLLVSSYYEVKDDYLKTSFGIIKSKYNISEIETILLDRETNKLTVHFKNQNFIVIVVKPEWYNEFITAILEKNPRIEYTIRSKENSPDDEKKG